MPQWSPVELVVPVTRSIVKFKMLWDSWTVVLLVVSLPFHKGIALIPASAKGTAPTSEADNVISLDRALLFTLCEVGTAPTSEAAGIWTNLLFPFRVATPLALPFSLFGISILTSAGEPASPWGPWGPWGPTGPVSPWIPCGLISSWIPWGPWGPITFPKSNVALLSLSCMINQMSVYDR